LDTQKAWTGLVVIPVASKLDRASLAPRADWCCIERNEDEQALICLFGWSFMEGTSCNNKWDLFYAIAPWKSRPAPVAMQANREHRGNFFQIVSWQKKRNWAMKNFTGSYRYRSILYGREFYQALSRDGQKKRVWMKSWCDFVLTSFWHRHRR
jgi:hypothetical protein